MLESLNFMECLPRLIRNSQPQIRAILEIGFWRGLGLGEVEERKAGRDFLLLITPQWQQVLCSVPFPCLLGWRWIQTSIPA